MMGHRPNPIRNSTRRLEREIRHEQRAIEERSKTISGFENIKKIETFFYGKGGIEKPQDTYVIYFTLKEPVLIRDFENMVKEKLRDVIIKGVG